MVMSSKNLFENSDPSVRPLQWGRKLFHVFNGSVGFWLYVYSGLSRSTVLIILGAFILLNLAFDAARIYSANFAEVFSKRFEAFIRPTEKREISSATKGLAAALFVLLFFPEPIGILVMLFVTYGDTAGGIVGALIKSPRLNSHASVSGSLAVWLVCSLATAWAFAYPLANSVAQEAAGFGVIILSGLIGAFAEAVLPEFDDNLVLPLLSAPLLMLLWSFFHIL